MQQTGTGTGHWINMLVPKNSIKSCQKYVKVVEYWHGTIKNYRYVGEVSAPGSIFHHIYFRSTILQSFIFRSINPKIFYLLFSFIYLYQVSPLQVTVKGLTTPLSRWVQVFDCLCRCIYWGLANFSYWIDTLVLN